MHLQLLEPKEYIEIENYMLITELIFFIVYFIQ